MELWAKSFEAIWANHWLCLVTLAGLAAATWHARRQARLQASERAHERRVREELEAYVGLDLSLDLGMDAVAARRALAMRVCRAVAQKSVFTRVTMLLRNSEGRLTCVGSLGADDLTVAAMQVWGEKAVEEERRTKVGASASPGEKSFAIALGEWGAFDQELSVWAAGGKTERRRWRRGIVAPLRTRAGRMMGAIAVCADGQASELVGRWGGFAGAMGGIEILASRVVAAMESELMAERLLRAEKLGVSGRMAGDVVDVVNDPLTAVLELHCVGMGEGDVLFEEERWGR